MQVEIIIQGGQAKLLTPLYLKPGAPMHFRVEVPDDAILLPRDIYPEDIEQNIPPQTPPAKPGSLQERFNQILGPLAVTRPGASIGDDHQTLLDALEDRYLGR